MTPMHEVSISLCNSKIEISITISILTYKWKIESLFKEIAVVREDVEFIWLQQQPAAANLYRKCYTLLLNAASFWLQPVVMNFDVFPKIILTYESLLPFPPSTLIVFYTQESLPPGQALGVVNLVSCVVEASL